MSSTPNPEEEELFRLYVRSTTDRDITPKETVELQDQLRQRLREIWDRETRPIDLVFDDFRKSMIEKFLDRLRKQDPGFRRPRF
jgi:hypothetical protein